MASERLLAVLTLALGAGAACAQATRPAHPGSGYGTADSPGHSVVALGSRNTRDLVPLGRSVDPTAKLTAEEYHHFLTGLRALRQGKKLSELTEDERKALAKLDVDAARAHTDTVQPFRDDPIYAIDPERKMGPVTAGKDGAVSREVPVIEIPLTRVPMKVTLQRYFIHPRPFLAKQETFLFRTLVPIWRRGPDGKPTDEPYRLVALDSVAERPKDGSTKIVLPVDAKGDPVVVSRSDPGPLSPSRLSRRNYAEVDQINAYDNGSGTRMTPEELVDTVVDAEPPF